MRNIIGIGETVLDIIFVDDQPQRAVPGGSTFNAMISLGRVFGGTKDAPSVKMITETGDDHVGNGLVVGLVGPALTLEPCCAAARLLGRQDVLVEAVADDEDFV